MFEVHAYKKSKKLDEEESKKMMRKMRTAHCHIRMIWMELIGGGPQKETFA